jgi:hypothetical protein
VYRELPDLGPAVCLTRHRMFALTRYESVIRALKDASTLSSASGVMMNDDMNASDDGFSCDSRVLRFGVAIPALISVYLSRRISGYRFLRKRTKRNA